MRREPILIIDDNFATLKLARAVLAREGYRVRTVTDARAAPAAIKQVRPRLILMDPRLPGLDGLELTRRFKADPHLQGVIILALTASTRQGEAERLFEAGCDGFLTTPMDPWTLSAVVAGYLRADSVTQDVITS